MFQLKHKYVQLKSTCLLSLDPVCTKCCINDIYFERVSFLLSYIILYGSIILPALYKALKRVFCTHKDGLKNIKEKQVFFLICKLKMKTCQDNCMSDNQSKMVIYYY